MSHKENAQLASWMYFWRQFWIFADFCILIEIIDVSLPLMWFTILWSSILPVLVFFSQRKPQTSLTSVFLAAILNFRSFEHFKSKKWLGSSSYMNHWTILQHAANFGAFLTKRTPKWLTGCTMTVISCKGVDWMIIISCKGNSGWQ